MRRVAELKWRQGGEKKLGRSQKLFGAEPNYISTSSIVYCYCVYNNINIATESVVRSISL
jgi:hypothetical protein